MIVPAASSLALCVVGFETAAWLLLVPATVTVSTFVFANGLAVSMFFVGMMSAANGQQTRSVAQLLYDVENDRPARARSADA